MKKQMAYILFLIMMTLMATAAELPSRKSLVAAALDDYGKVAGAWFINEKCKFVSGNDSKTFEENVATITVALGQDLGGPTMLYAVQKSAKTASEKEPYSKCENKAKEVFDYGFGHARNWSAQIKKIQSGKKG